VRVAAVTSRRVTVWDARGHGPLHDPAVTLESPTAAELWLAVEAYLAVAYDGLPPKAVEERLSKLRGAQGAGLYECGAFECLDDRRYALRLGNRFYPHMKIVVEASPSGSPLFRTDTHDRHFLDLVGPAQAELQALMAKNQEIAEAVEERWAACEVPTTRAFWRGQMARRRVGRPP
jgi:hypothetical protein